MTPIYMVTGIDPISALIKTAADLYAVEITRVCVNGLTELSAKPVGGTGPAWYSFRLAKPDSDICDDEWQDAIAFLVNNVHAWRQANA